MKKDTKKMIVINVMLCDYIKNNERKQKVSFYVY